MMIGRRIANRFPRLTRSATCLADAARTLGPGCHLKVSAAELLAELAEQGDTGPIIETSGGPCNP